MPFEAWISGKYIIDKRGIWDENNILLGVLLFAKLYYYGAGRIY